MKVAILTYQNALNIGAVLQAYALQKVIENMNYKCEILDYRSPYLENLYKQKKITSITSLKTLIKYILNSKNDQSKRKKFTEFKERHLKFSDDYYNPDNITDSNSNYDVYIVGSDQVWNMNLNGGDKRYFLDFVNRKRKFSYAASFGYKEIPAEYKEITKIGLKNLDNISVRETSGKEIVQNTISENSEVVLDPTLLLDKKNWENLISDRIIKEEYVLVYVIADTPRILDFAKEIGRKYDCKVICIHNSPIPKAGVKNIRDCSPLEYLNYIKYAKTVLSSSFHGLCFSILLEKDFYFELDQRPVNNNSRIETLVNLLGLWEREIKNQMNLPQNEIDFKAIAKKLYIERLNSVSFIEENLNFENK